MIYNNNSRLIRYYVCKRKYCFVCVCFSFVLFFFIYVFLQHVHCRWKIRRPFKKDKKHVENDQCNTTLQKEWDWMIDIIKCYTRITELVRTNIFMKLIF